MTTPQLRSARTARNQPSQRQTWGRRSLLALLGLFLAAGICNVLFARSGRGGGGSSDNDSGAINYADNSGPDIAAPLVLPGGGAYNVGEAQPLAKPQYRPNANPKAVAHVEIDLPTLILAPEVFAATSEGPIWKLHPASGRFLIQIPLVVKPGDDAYMLDGGTFHIRGGRIIGYRFSDLPPMGPLAEQNEKMDLTNSVDGPPLTAKAVSIYPDGTMRWKMDSFLGSGDVKVVPKLYAFKCNPKLLAATNPPPLPESTYIQGAGEPLATFIQRKITAQQDHHQKVAAYQELRRKVHDTATLFEAPITPLVWIVADVSAAQPNLDIAGPRPLPWVIGLDTLRLMRDNFKPITFEDSPGHIPRLARAYEQLAANMTVMAADEQYALNPRIVANMIALTSMAQGVDRSKSLYTLLETVLKSKDSQARNIVTKELLLHTIPNYQTMALLRLAAANMDPGLKIDDLKFKLAQGMADPQALTEATDAANRTLQDPAGPEPRDILKPLIDEAQANPQMTPILINQIRFNAMPDKRFAQAVVAVIEAAPSSQLASGWLDHQLLGAVEPLMVSKTLEALNASGTTGNQFGAVVDAGMNALFGAPKMDAQADRANLPAPIPIESTSHALFQALVASDVQIRTMAWRALSRFTFVTTPAAAPAAGVVGQAIAAVGDLANNADVYQVLLDKALVQQNTPRQVVDFLVRQSNNGRVADCLTALVVKADDEVSAQATRALLHSRGALPVDQSMLNLSYGDRVSFAQRIYENVTGQPAPLLTGLLQQRVDNSPLPAWLGKSISDGEVPPPSAWVKAIGGPDKMLELVLSNDSGVAMGAMSALVWSAGGNDRIAPALEQEFRSLPDQSPKNLMAHWLLQKKKIILDWVRRFAGAYRLVLRLGPAPAGTTAPTGDIALGMVQLLADDTGVHLSNQSLALSVSDSDLAIVMEKPAELKNFSNDVLAKLQVQSVVTPVELLPQLDGSWQGRFILPDTQSVDVIFQPSNGG